VTDVHPIETRNAGIRSRKVASFDRNGPSFGTNSYSAVAGDARHARVAKIGTSSTRVGLVGTGPVGWGQRPRRPGRFIDSRRCRSARPASDSRCVRQAEKFGRWRTRVRRVGRFRRRHVGAAAASLPSRSPQQVIASSQMLPRGGVREIGAVLSAPRNWRLHQLLPASSLVDARRRKRCPLSANTLSRLTSSKPNSLGEALRATYGSLSR